MPDTAYQEHFASAATRHFHDADYLRADERLPTADHLYGFAAECAAKSLLLRFTAVTMAPRPGKNVDAKIPWVERPDAPGKFVKFGHVNKLIGEMGLLAHGRSGAPLHAALDSDLREFADWDVKYRYSDGTYVEADVVGLRRDAAHRILALHEQALLNERLP